MNNDARPIHVTTARKVPIRFQEEANKTIKELLDKGVITPVTTPTLWCSPAFFVPKADNKRVRLVTDYTALNKHVQRPTHPFPSSRDIMQSIPADAKVFAKMDAVHGYFQLGMDEESSYLTTFLLPSGRYRYLRAPMGLSASSDEWCRRSDIIISGLSYARKIVDDTLVWAPTWEVLHERCREVLKRCRKYGITISLRKFELGTSIPFAGHIVSNKGIKPDPSLTEALSKFPTPTSVTELRSLLGLANQLASFVPDMAHMTASMRQLLKKNSAWTWLDQHQQEFHNLRHLLTSSLIVHPFDANKHTYLLTDASRLHGLGYALMQPGNNGNLHLITCGSCSITDTQKRYATIELECLAIQWATHKCDYYLRGGSSAFTVLTDHKPLVGIFKKGLHELDNPRLQRIREKLSMYSFEVQWVSGKTHLIADALSRAPLFQPPEPLPDDTIDSAVMCFRATSDPALQIIHDGIDDAYLSLINAIQSTEDPQDLGEHHPARPYSKVWQHLSVITDSGTDLVMYNCRRLVVPGPARNAILRALHTSHSGHTKTRQLATQLYFWPGMLNDIAQTIDACEACQKRLPSLAALPPKVQLPSEAVQPMTMVGVDLMSCANQQWLILVDRYSGYPWAMPLRSTTTKTITNNLTAWFQAHGWPERIRTDGGPQFRGDFQNFCKEHSIIHELSSAHNPKSNGLAEAAVKSIKNLLLKCRENGDNFDKSLYAWRNTPRADGFSPFEMYFGRKGRQPNLPSLSPVAIPDLDTAATLRDEKAIDNANYSGIHVQSQKPLHIGQSVIMQNHRTGAWDREAKVHSVRRGNMSYIVESQGQQYIRSRRFLRPSPSFTPVGRQPPAVTAATTVLPPAHTASSVGPISIARPEGFYSNWPTPAESMSQAHRRMHYRSKH